MVHPVAWGVLAMARNPTSPDAPWVAVEKLCFCPGRWAEAEGRAYISSFTL
jgi:hypothetical protein